jgi:hypothetical protein
MIVLNTYDKFISAEFSILIQVQSLESLHQLLLLLLGGQVVNDVPESSLLQFLLRLQLKNAVP